MPSRNRTRLASFLAIFLAFPGTIYADLGEDTHIQETGEVRLDVDRAAYEELSRLFDLGYPPATVMMHAITTGMSLNDILYIAVKSDLSRAQEFYDTAESLVPVLPGWVCQEPSDRDRYIKAVKLSDLGSQPTIQQVADVFFNQNRRVVPFPDWEDGRVHMTASVAELAGLMSDERWYVPGKDDGTPLTAPNRPVFVSLYKYNNEIVVDNAARIRKAQQQGIKSLPVVLVYNDIEQRPITSFPPAVTAAQIAQYFYSEGLELTAVPEWPVDDHHKMASPDELRDVVEIPKKDDIPPEKLAAAEQKLRDDGMKLPEPLLLTLIRSGQGRAWINDPTEVVAADELGVKELPVVFFYHRIDRTPCGEPARCEDMLCEAATSAGASPKVCESNNQNKANTAGVGGSGRAIAAPTGNALGLTIDPRLYQGLRYTQSQCTS